MARIRIVVEDDAGTELEGFERVYELGGNLDGLWEIEEAMEHFKRAALITYLEKHQQEIIDYQRRQRTGKSIGSGRMEKGVDRVIGARQKGKGMSWSPAGSKALGILKVIELNHQWEALWFPEQAAA